MYVDVHIRVCIFIYIYFIVAYKLSEGALLIRQDDVADCMYVHTHTHTRPHTYTPTHTLTQTHTHAQSLSFSHKNMGEMK